MQCLTMDGLFGNPASYRFGWQAEEAVDLARNQMAELIGADPRGSSSHLRRDRVQQPWPSKGVAHFYAGKASIVTSKTEHKAVLDTCRQLEREGYG